MSQLFIDGRYADSQRGSFSDVFNPANSSVVGQAPDGDAVDIDRAVAAAKAALPGWAALNEDDRYAALQGVAARLKSLDERLGSLLVAEGGLTQREARASLDAAISALQYPTVSRESRSPMIRAVLGPASSPFLPVVGQVSMALMAGDTVVIKPPAGGVLTHLAMASVWTALPCGVVNVLSGDIATGQALTLHEGIGGVSMTGSATVAGGLAAMGKPITADTGGVDAAIVFRDADLDLAVRAIAWSRLRHGGRTCISSRRIYVDAAVAGDFTVRLHEYVGLLEVDDPAKPASLLGPLGSAAAAKACEGRVVKSMREGARLVLGGFRFRPAGLKGHWLQPTILADIQPGHLPMREEMSGPVLTVSTCADASELQSVLAHSSMPANVSLYGADEDALCAWAANLPARAIWLNLPQSDYVSPAPDNVRRHTFRPAYPAHTTPDFYELDPLRIWSAT